jgi:hypothetical protein
MTTPVSARDHANMTIAEREFTFDALLADFEQLDDRTDEADTSTAATVRQSSVGDPRVDESQIGDQPAQPVQAPDADAPHPARQEALVAAPGAAPRRAPMRLPALALPSPQVLKLGGLIAVAVLSLTLVFIALSL